MEINNRGEFVLVICPNPSIDIYARIDKFSMGSTTRVKEEKRFPGGKGVHVAMALSELGISVVLLGVWGGITGQWIKKEINRRYPRIVLGGVEVEDWSRSCYTFKTNDKTNDSELLGVGPTINNDTFNKLLKSVNQYLLQSKAIVLSGSWPAGADASNYRKLIAEGRENNIPAFVDSTGEQLQNALKEHPYCVHLNKKELIEFTGNTNFQSSISEFRKHTSVSAITDGANGLYYSTNAKSIHSLRKVEKVLSTIGSGDCLLAGIVAAHVLNLSDQEIADWGAASGAANCMHEDLGMLLKADVEKLIGLGQEYNAG